MDGLRCIDSYTRVCLNRSQTQITIDSQRKKHAYISPALESQKKSPTKQNTILTYIKPVLNLQTKNRHYMITREQRRYFNSLYTGTTQVIEDLCR